MAFFCSRVFVPKEERSRGLNHEWFVYFSIGVFLKFSFIKVRQKLRQPCLFVFFVCLFVSLGTAMTPSQP